MTNTLRVAANNSTVLTMDGTTATVNSNLVASNATLGSMAVKGGTGQLTMLATSSTAVIQTEQSQSLTFKLNASGTAVFPMQFYSSGVVNIGNNSSNNKVLALYDSGAADAPSTATNFYGFGMNSGTLRYQASNGSGGAHKFYSGNTLDCSMASGSSTSGSDVRWKSNIQDLIDALSKILALRGRTFQYMDVPKRQMGLIAQECEEIVPEVVFTDPDDGYKTLAYDRLTALCIEGIKDLAGRVSYLEDQLTRVERFLGF